jgi:hypothetical protein
VPFYRGPGFYQPVEGTYLAADTAGMAIRINRLPAAFVVPAQPVLASKPAPIGPAKSNMTATKLNYRPTGRFDGPALYEVDHVGAAT